MSFLFSIDTGTFSILWIMQAIWFRYRLQLRNRIILLQIIFNGAERLSDRSLKWRVFNTLPDLIVSSITVKRLRGKKMPAIKRVFSERRSGKERRKVFSLHRFFYKGPERRQFQDRRSQVERREGWIRITKWSSVKMQDLKISKYLQQR